MEAMPKMILSDLTLLTTVVGGSVTAQVWLKSLWAGAIREGWGLNHSKPTGMS